MKIAINNQEEAKQLLEECIDIATEESQLVDTCSMAEQCQRLTEDRRELERTLFAQLDLDSLKSTVDNSVAHSLSDILHKLNKEFHQLAFVKPQSFSFLNESTLTVTHTGPEKTWENKTGGMVHIRSANIITEGTHVLRLQSLNDPGGFTVIGISDAEQTDQQNCIGLAGNSFCTNHKAKNIGAWTNSLTWGTNDVLELVVDVPNLLFTFKNETRQTSISTKLETTMFGNSEEWRFSLFIWGSYKQKLLDQSINGVGLTQSIQVQNTVIEDAVPVITYEKFTSSTKNKWKGSSESIQQLLIDSNPLKGGVHRVKFKAENDPGGFTVIGITANRNMGSSYTNAIALAGNGYSGTNNMGTWDTTLQWAINQEVEFTLDCSTGKLCATNLSTSTKATFTFSNKDELANNSYFFSFSVWNSYEYSILSQSCNSNQATIQWQDKSVDTSSKQLSSKDANARQLDQNMNRGIHKFSFKTDNDKGGYTVIGLNKDRKGKNYNDCCGQAGDTYSNNGPFSGEWSTELGWGEKSTIEVTVDSQIGEFTIKNVTRNKQSTFKCSDPKEFYNNNIYFALYVWNGYNIEIENQSCQM